MTSFCGSDNDENDYEIGYKEGAAVLYGLIAMAEAINARHSIDWRVEAEKWKEAWHHQRLATGEVAAYYAKRSGDWYGKGPKRGPDDR